MPPDGRVDVDAVGERVERLLDEVRASADPAVAGAAEDLVRALVELYGEGLAHVLRVVAADEAGERLLDQLTADPLVESLLLVHDLHPVDVDTRIQRALDQVRPYLGSHAGGVEYHGVDSDGMVHLTLEGTCHGCPSSTVTVRSAIERAVQQAAPETAGIVVEGLAEPPPSTGLLQILRCPPGMELAGAGAPASGGQTAAVDTASTGVPRMGAR